MDLAFGDCELSVDRMELRRGGQIVAIEPQVFEVLAHLVAHRTRVVTKHELLDDIWGDRFVSESALTSRIKAARRLIGDTGRDQRMIKTVHGRGYRFVAEVSAAGRGAERPPASQGDGRQAGLGSLVAAVVSGRGHAVELVGDSGAIADTADQLVDDAVAAGLVVGRASGASGGGRTFSAFVAALDEMTQRDPSLLEAIPPACRAELERLFTGDLPSTRQRLFVAARELLVAAARNGALLVLESLTASDTDTIALAVEAARIARRHAIAVVVSQRVSRGLPGFERVPLATGAGTHGAGAGIDVLSPAVADVVARAALVGSQLDRLDMLAAADGDAELAELTEHDAVEAGVFISTAPGRVRFADPSLVDELVTRLPNTSRSTARTRLAEQLDRAGAGPARVAAQLLDAGEAEAAAPFALAAARAAANANMHGEVLRWVDAVREASPGDSAAELLVLRADALAATGAPTAVAAYRAALAAAPASGAVGLRCRLARAAMLSGDLASAEEALDGLAPAGGPDDGPLLLVQGMLAYFRGDLDAAEAAARAARSIALAPGAPAQLLDVITLQGMIAHNRGEWFDRLRRELQATSENPTLATTVFDSHLCVAEYLLYGPTAYEEVRRLADELRAQAERAGARRGVAFAVTVAGEAALLAGDLDRARRDLERAIQLHREIGADTGTAHAMQRLAEVQLASGEPAAAERLARQALALARWSPLSRHLLQRIYGTLIAAAPDAPAAVAVVDEAAETLDDPAACVSCEVMIAVPAAIACANTGRLDDARRHVAAAERSAMMWQGTSWQAAITEAKAYLARAEGRADLYDDLLAEAASLFAIAGQPLDAERCQEARASLTAQA